MTIVLGNETRLRDEIAGALREGGHRTTVITPDHEDPFAEACGHDSVVYIPDAPDRAQAKVALSAARAPGVGVLVVVLPLEGYDEVVDLVRRDGKPYVILRRPALFDELTEALDGRRMVILSRGETVRAIDMAALTAAVVEAIHTEEHGDLRQLAPDPLPKEVALRRAAATTGRRTRVVALWPPLARALAWLERLFAPARPPALPAPAR